MATGVGLKPIDFAWNSLYRNTEVFEIESKAAGVTYVVFVATPPGYEADTKRTYPVIFAPDGNGMVSLSVPSVTAATTLELIHPIEPFIHVAVGYRSSEISGPMDFLAIRARDLLPPGEPMPAGVEASMQDLVDRGVGDTKGTSAYLQNLRDPHGDRFLAFLGDELYPMIASRWRIDPARSAFFGYSYGGLFAMWLAMQKHPRFPIVCAGSPGVMVDDSKVYEALRQQRETKADHSGRHLHMTVCDKEITEPTIYQLLSTQWARLLADLGASPLPGLRLTSYIIPGETHISGKSSTWYSFLRTCFPAKRPSETAAS